MTIDQIKLANISSWRQCYTQNKKGSIKGFLQSENPYAVREGFRKRVLQENPLDNCNCTVWFQFSWTQPIIDLKVMPQLTYQNQEIKRLTNLPLIGPKYY